MAESIARKILEAHKADAQMSGTDSGEMALRPDQILLQDATGTMAWMQFEQLRRDRVQVPLVVQYIDHNMIQLDNRNADDHLYLRDVCNRYGALYSVPGNGISHYVHLERFARPGSFVAGADSHTTTSGAAGMVAIGAGGLDVAAMLAGEPLRIRRQQIVGVELQGDFAPWAGAKDLILELLRRRGVRGGINRIFEFWGEGVSSLSITERATVCNMIAELGATSAIFPSDSRTLEWLKENGREQDWADIPANGEAEFDERESIDLRSLEPLIALPGSPGNVVPVPEVAGQPVAQVCVGSSVNSGFADLALVAAIMNGHQVAPGVSMTLTPGSNQIQAALLESGDYRVLLSAGVRILEAACGPCVGLGQAPPSNAISVRTFNRNFPGRSGNEYDQVYLCSPATAAATALTGLITDPRTLGGKPPEVGRAPKTWPRPGSILAPPEHPHSRRAVSIRRGPNLRPPQIADPLPDTLSGQVLIVLGDDISTGDLSPDGANVLAFRSNIEAMSKFVLARIDPSFSARAARGGGVIVAGENYGQGSSREHAALAPRHLGIWAVVAKSYARIHRRNLLAQGILAFTFADAMDYPGIEAGYSLTLKDVRSAIERRQETIAAECAGRRISLNLPLSGRERDVVLSGGLLPYLRERGRK